MPLGILPQIDASRPWQGLHRLDHVQRLQALPEDGLGTVLASQADGEWPEQEALEAYGVPEHTAALMTSTRSLFSTTTSSYASLQSHESQ